MIIGYEQPVFCIGSGTYEVKIQVQGQDEIYTQKVQFQSLKSATEYMGFLDMIINGRKQKTK